MRPPPLKPHRVVVLALDSVVPFDLAVPCQVFGFGGAAQDSRYYTVTVCGPDHPTRRRRGAHPIAVRTANGFSITVERGLSALRLADTVVVPGIADIDGPVPDSVRAALRRAYARGARIVSICTGAFVLAAAGLLDGRRATTHWADTQHLAARYPGVSVVPDVLYVDEGKVLSSAGIAAGLDLCLHLVRRDYGAEVANATARRLVVAPHRSGGQAQFAEEPVAPETGGGLEQLRTWLLSRLASAVTLSEMATHAGMSRRSFIRRFRSETGTSPLRWLIHQRVISARRLLELSSEPVERIATRCGFRSALSLRQHFRRATGVPPAAYRRMFQGSHGDAPRRAASGPSPRSGPAARRRTRSR